MIRGAVVGRADVEADVETDVEADIERVKTAGQTDRQTGRGQMDGIGAMAERQSQARLG